MSISSVSGVEEISYSYFKLTEDVSMSEMCSSIESLPQGSTLDGDGHIITGLTEPLFQKIEENSTVKDLTIKDSEITSSKKSAGVLAAKSKGSTLDSITIMDCSVESSDAVSTGLLCGYCKENSVTDITVRDSDIDSSCTTGGLIGRINSTLEIKNCVVDNCQISGKSMVGGLVGFSNNSLQLTDVTVKNSDIDGVQKIGGILGEGKLHLRGCISENCFVNGIRHIGGIVGILNRSSNEKTVLERCFCDNTVRGGDKNVGGFAGSMYSVSITGCFASGTVKSPSPCGFAKVVSDSNIENSYCDNSLVSTLDRECISFINTIESSQIKNCFVLTTSNLEKGDVISEIESTEIADFYLNTDVTPDTEVGTDTDIDSISDLKTITMF